MIIDRNVSARHGTPEKRGVILELTYIHLSNIANVADNRIGLRVYISNKIASEALPQLQAERAAIEDEIGSPLEWNPNANAIDKIILLDRDADLTLREKWPEYLSWLAEQVGKFKKAFEPRIRKLVISSQADSAAENFGSTV